MVQAGKDTFTDINAWHKISFVKNVSPVSFLPGKQTSTDQLAAAKRALLLPLESCTWWPHWGGGNFFEVNISWYYFPKNVRQNLFDFFVMDNLWQLIKLTKLGGWVGRRRSKPCSLTVIRCRVSNLAKSSQNVANLHFIIHSMSLVYDFFLLVSNFYFSF